MIRFIVGLFEKIGVSRITNVNVKTNDISRNTGGAGGFLNFLTLMY